MTPTSGDVTERPLVTLVSVSENTGRKMVRSFCLLSCLCVFCNELGLKKLRKYAPFTGTGACGLDKYVSCSGGFSVGEKPDGSAGPRLN